MTEPEPLIETTPAPPGMSRSQTGQRWRTPLGALVEVWQAAPLGRPNDWRWNVKGRNGEIMDHGEGHTRWRNARRAAMRYHPPADPAGELHVVFDGPPGPVAGRFVETENADGQGVTGYVASWTTAPGGDPFVILCTSERPGFPPPKRRHVPLCGAHRGEDCTCNEVAG